MPSTSILVPVRAVPVVAEVPTVGDVPVVAEDPTAIAIVVLASVSPGFGAVSIVWVFTCTIMHFWLTRQGD